MDQVFAFVYFNGSISVGDEGVMFGGESRGFYLKRDISFKRLKRRIHDKLQLGVNQVISSITSRFLASDNPVSFTSFQIRDTEDVNSMMSSFQHQSVMRMLELYVDITEAGGSSIPVETYPSDAGVTHVDDVVAEEESGYFGATINLGDDNDNVDPAVYCSEDDVIEDDRLLEPDSSDSDVDRDFGVNLETQSTLPSPPPPPPPPPHSPYIATPHTQGVANTNAFWNSSSQYKAINWDYPDEETDFYPGVDVPGSWSVGEDLYVGLRFNSKEETQLALKQYCLHLNQTYVIQESCPKYFTAKCPNSVNGCPWKIRAMLSKKTDKWTISKWGGPHTCVSAVSSLDHKKLNSDFIASRIIGMVQLEPAIPISLLQERISGELKYKVSYFKAWHAKQKAIAKIFGTWEASYDELPRWLAHMTVYSPGSYFKVLTVDCVDGDGQVDPNIRKFVRVFWTFKQCCDAFVHCKPMIQVDGTFLYGKYKHTLLIATSQDGNNQILPIAFAIVEGESTSSWSWFLRLIRTKVTQKGGLCLISDRHAGIKAAVANASNGWQPPYAYHVYCLRHIASNFNHKFHNTKLKGELINMGYEPCPFYFERRLERFRQNSLAIQEWINGIPKETWSLACDFEGRRFGHMTTNLSECINKVLKGARCLPITAIVKCTYGRLVEYFVQRETIALAELEVGKVYCDKVMAKMESNARDATCHIVRLYNVERTRFEVEEGFNPRTPFLMGKKWMVFLDTRKCECGRFQAYRYPCSHVIAACASQGLDYYKYVDPAYTIKSLVAAYAPQWYPIGNDLDMEQNNGPRIIPNPATVRGKGRPKSTRIRNEMDLRESQPSRRSASLQR